MSKASQLLQRMNSINESFKPKIKINEGHKWSVGDSVEVPDSRYDVYGELGKIELIEDDQAYVKFDEDGYSKWIDLKRLETPKPRPSES